jgi:hypothetical protein
MNALANMRAIPVGPLNMTAIVVGLVVSVAFGVGMQICLRLLMGDRLRKATPNEQRWCSAFFVFMPIWMWLCVHIGHSYLDRAAAVGIWLYMTGCGLVGVLWLWFWARFVPANVSWWLAGFVWVITLWLAFTCRF